jgi:hypothetical protein
MFRKMERLLQDCPLTPPIRILIGPTILYKTQMSNGSIYVGECDSKRRKSGYGHCRFNNDDLYHGLYYIQGVPLHMGFIVKNPSKRSVSLKNGLEENKVKLYNPKLSISGV